MALQRDPLSLRAVHLDLVLQHYRWDRYLEFVERAAGWGYNAILLEYGNMFPFRTHREICHRDRWSEEQVATFQRCAQRNGLEVIPLVQTLGHLGFALRRGSYRRFAEDPREQDGIVESICPTNPHAVALVQDLVREVLEAHPRGRFVHLGGDEALLGVCPVCKEQTSKHGKGRHYALHMNLFVRMALDRGQRPIVWADCLEHHPDGLHWLDRRTILCDWFYESVSLKQDWVFVRAGDFSGSVLGDTPAEEIRPNSPRYWAARGSWSPILTRHSVGKIPSPLRRALEPYWAHRVEEYPKRFYGFPYVRYLKDKGFEVMFAATMRSSPHDNRYAVNYSLHLKNCLAAAEALAQAQAMGAITTHWSASGLGPLQSQYLGMAIAAEAYRRPGRTDPQRVAAAYERRTFGRPCGLLEAYRRLFECSYSQRYAFTGETFEPRNFEEEMATIGSKTDLLECMTVLRGLTEWSKQVGLKHPEIRFIDYAARELLHKYRVALAYREWQVSPRLIDIRSLRNELRAMRELHRRTFSRYLTPWSLKMESRLRFDAEQHWLNGQRHRRAAPRSRRPRHRAVVTQ